MKLNLNHLPEYLQLGQKDKNWYEETNTNLTSLFPEENIGYLSDIIAATSIHSSLPSNVRQFFKAKSQLEANLELTGYLPAIVHQLEHIRAGRPLSGRKIRNFSEAIQGNQDAVVVDIWIMRVFGLQSNPQRSPSKKEYDIIENYIKGTAPLLGLQPRQFCAMLWAGIRIKTTGKQNSTRFEHCLQREMGQHKIEFI